MAKSIDVAVRLLEKSIERGKYDSAYYMDFVKLHKLMYLGQCYLNYMYGMNWFEEEITANNDGPYIDGIYTVPAICGFSEIKNIDNLKQYLGYVLPLSFSREEACDLILDTYGKCSTSEIVKICKNTPAYSNTYIKNENLVIQNRELLIETGKNLFEEKSGPTLVKKRK